MGASRRCSICNVFVSVNQLDVAAGDSNNSLVMDGSRATVHDRLVLLCQMCLSEIVNADVSFSFEVDHPAGKDHAICGIPTKRVPMFEIRNGRRFYGVDITCAFLDRKSVV